MENFSLTDLAWILGSVIAFAVACVVMPPLFRYGPKIIVSLFYRFVYVDFDTLMSRLADVGDAGDARSTAAGDAGDAGDLRLQHQHQVNDENDLENASPRASIVLRQLPKEELIVMLAIQKKDDGGFLWSSNDIKKFVPGADGPIGEIIASVRGKKAPDPPAKSLQRPAKGW